MESRHGVLGLETARQVFITFLILSVTGIAVILALTSLQTASEPTVDTRTVVISVANESDFNVAGVVSANRTGYTFSGFNTSWSGITVTEVWNTSSQGAGNGGFNITVPTANVSVNGSNLLVNGTNAEYSNISVSYSYTNTYSLGRVSNIVGNVSAGLVTFFGSTGTIFSILVVVVIILAISIIIWAVGRFGQQTEQAVL